MLKVHDAATDDHDTSGEFCDEFCAPESTGCACPPPPIWGGQNHTPEELEADGAVLGQILLWGFFFTVGLCVGLAL